MLIACWSVKGGVGTTVVAAGAALAAVETPQPPLLVDLAGDLPDCLGIHDPAGPGLAEWLDAGPEVRADALARLVVPCASDVELLPRGRGPLTADRVPALLQVLSSMRRTVVVDCGRIEGPGAAAMVAAQADRSILVTRLCVLALRRAATMALCPSGVVIVREAGRGLSADDVVHVVGVPVVAELALDPAVARAVDAGMLAARLPRRFNVAVRAVAA